MNYKSQLKSWAIDRVIKAHEAGVLKVEGLDQIQAFAEQLIEYTYVVEEDIGATGHAFLELLNRAPDDKDTAALVQMMIDTLQRVQEKLSHKPELAVEA